MNRVEEIFAFLDEKFFDAHCELNYSKENGYNYAVATIHPDNIYSINIFKFPHSF